MGSSNYHVLRADDGDNMLQATKLRSAVGKDFLRHVRGYAAASEASPIQVRSLPAPHSGSIRVLLLDKPETRNALSRRLLADLGRHVDEIQAEGGNGATRALVIASNVDKAFCSGADLKERRGMTQDE